MLNLRQLLLGGLLAVTASAGSVIDLIPDNFNSIVLESGKPALVEFFAPWCGHCKNLAPVYEELAEGYSHAQNKVTIAKVDADEHRDLGKEYGVQGFPYVKMVRWEEQTPQDYKGGRDIESLSSFIVEKTGIKPKGKKSMPSNVRMLNDKTFKEEVRGEKNVLVAFTAPWCGHCKTLAPIWETLASDFANEPSVLVAKVDAESPDSKAIAQEHGVTSYPTIKYFPKGSTAPLPYEGARSEKDFVAYINEHAGTRRMPGGALDATAGTIEALDAVVGKFMTEGTGLVGAKEQLQSIMGGLQDKYTEYYGKVLDKIASTPGYVDKELGRLEGLLKKGGLAPEKVDDLISRSNILRKFVKDGGKSEL